MRRSTVMVEMSDGSVYGPERVIFADKMQFERSARANNWKLTDEFRLQSFLSWAVLKRLGTLDLAYDQFMEQLVDIAFTGDAEDDDEDPTAADISA